ncbi:MAG TPA: sigma-70 family RNA polymerase sigma factor [Gammaproteobacteria bacterium]
MDERPDIDADAIATERKYLYRYALARLRDPDLAQDVVQDAIVAAMAASGSFRSGASLRTWLIAILRNKIVDAVRIRSRTVPLAPHAPDEDAIDDEIDRQFSPDGHWASGRVPMAWANPEAAFESAEFWTVFERCLERVPGRTAEVFVMREVLGESVPEICKILEISASNCSVMLYRARMRLKDCLSANWFSGGTADEA